jgi:hypothetical protein
MKKKLIAILLKTNNEIDELYIIHKQTILQDTHINFFHSSSK